MELPSGSNFVHTAQWGGQLMAFASDRSRAMLFGAGIASLLLLFNRPLLTVFRLAWSTDEYTHILLVLPVSLGLIYFEGRGKSFAAKGNLVAGIPLALVAIVLLGFGFSFPAAGLFLIILGFVLLCLSLVIMVYGGARFVSLLFPLLFLLLLAPVPIPWLDRAITFLQGASTELTFLLFRAVGIPVFKNGFVLALPGLQIEVAKQCSGIRSSLMLLVTALILGHLFLRTFWGQLAFAALVVPFAVAKNAVRIFTLSVLGIYVNRGFLEGHLHHDGGIVFFVLALGGLMLVLQGIRWLERPASPLPMVTKDFEELNSGVK